MVEAFDLYQACRAVQVLHVAVEEGERVQHIIVNLPSGYHHLPVAGGVLDQPCWTLAMFSHFWSGEVAAAQVQLNG